MRKSHITNYLFFEMEEIGTVVKARTRHMNTLYIKNSVRKPEFVYKFHYRKGNSYRCGGCRRVSKTRCVTTVNDTVVTSDTHPEDDHQCEQALESGT